MITFNLSIEEVAFALGHVGGADTAAGFLSTLIGERPADELTGRLTAAGHSLLARGLLALAPSAAEATLAPALRRAMESMVRGEDVLRVTVTPPDGEQVVSFFRMDSGALRHEVKQGVVSELVLLEDAASVQRAVADLVAPADLRPTATGPAGRIAAAQLRELRQKANTSSPAELASWLAGTLPPDLALEIGAVMCDASATWSATLRLLTNEIGTVEANRGIFTVFVAEKGWLFDMSGDPAQAQAEVYPLDRSSAAAAVARLMTA